MSENDYTLPGGYVLHLDDKQIIMGDNIAEQIFANMADAGDIDMAQYIASELVNQLWAQRISVLQQSDDPASIAELAGIKESGVV